MRRSLRPLTGLVASVIAIYLTGCEQKQQPKSFDEYVVRGELLTRGGDAKGAIENFQKALEIEPNSANVYYLWGNTLQFQNKADEAIEKYRKALELEPKLVPAHFGWATTLQKQGK